MCEKTSIRLLCLSLIISFMSMTISCGQSNESNPVGESQTNESSETDVVTDTTLVCDPELPSMDFEGRTFTFIGRGYESSTGGWDNIDIRATEMTGETLNDAVYKRNTYMSDTYNVKIDIIFGGDTGIDTTGSEMADLVQKSVMSQDGSFDAILTSPYDSVNYAQNGYLIDLNSLEYLNLTQPWWDQNANSQLSFGDKIYFTTGELTYVDNKATQIMLFDKKLVENYEIDDPYETVRSGKWTLDVFFDNAKKVTNDLNGDSIMNEADQFGYISWQDGCFGLLLGAGNRLGIINDEGIPEVTFYTEQMVNTWEKMIDFALSDAVFSAKNDLDLMTGSGLDNIIKYFLEAHTVLYTFGYINHAIQLRDSDTDFGILPLPKYDEAQENYVSAAHAYGTSLVSVPVSCSDPEFTGYVLEAFCAKSMEYVTPAFYEITLKGKAAQDIDSAEMLDLIFSTKVYDIGYFFAWGNMNNQIMSAWNSLDKNITSLYSSIENAIERDINKAIELFGANE